MRKKLSHPDRELVHGNAEMLVLAVLAGAECHGYQIRKELARRSRDYFQVTFGSLYPLLRRLEGRGLVKARWVKGKKVRERKEYQITPKGRAALQDRERRWHQFCEAMELVMRSRRR